MILVDTNVVSEMMRPKPDDNVIFPIPDGFIAAIAAARGFAVATRDIAPYEAAGLEVINPWSAAA